MIRREASNFTRRGDIDKRDTDQRPEMVYLSQPRMAQGGGVPLDQLDGQYSYDVSSGNGARVYMLDSVRVQPLTLKHLG